MIKLYFLISFILTLNSSFCCEKELIEFHHPLKLVTIESDDDPFPSGNRPYLGYEFKEIHLSIVKKENAKMIRDYLLKDESQRGKARRIFVNDGEDQILKFFASDSTSARGVSLGLGSNNARKMKNIQPTRDEIVNYISLYIKNDQVLSLIVPFVDLVLNDAKARGHEFARFFLTFRTENYQSFVDGHNHLSEGDLNYGLSPIGPGTEVDRFNPQEMKEEDYISTKKPNGMTIFGSVFHRSPKLKPKEERLFILISLTPARKLPSPSGDQLYEYYKNKDKK